MTEKNANFSIIFLASTLTVNFLVVVVVSLSSTVLFSIFLNYIPRKNYSKSRPF